MTRLPEQKLRSIYRPYDIGEPLPWKMETWSSTQPIFEELIAQERPSRIIEVGSWLGGSAIHMANICKRLGLDTQIICIDTWLGDHTFVEQPINCPWHAGVSYPYRQFASNMLHAELSDMVVPFPQTSVLAAMWLAENNVTAELIYIDAGHDEDSVASDCKRFWPLCTAVMFGDDLIRDEIRQPVKCFAQDRQLPLTDHMPHWMIETPAVHEAVETAKKLEIERIAQIRRDGQLQLARQKEARQIRILTPSQNAGFVPSLISAKVKHQPFFP